RTPQLLVAAAHAPCHVSAAVELAPVDRVRARQAVFNRTPWPQPALRLFVNHDRVPMPGLHRCQAPLAADAPHLDLTRRAFANLLLRPLAVRIPREYVNPLAARRENILLPVA